MIRIILCDDDPNFLEHMNQLIVKLTSEKGISAKIHAYTKTEAIGDPILASCDLAFLDIDFKRKDGNGLDLARRLRNFRKDSVIIFVTNYIEYAPEGYEEQAFRYCLKKDLGRHIPDYLDLAMEQLAERRETLKINVFGEIIDLRINSIMYAEADLRMVNLYVQKGAEIKQYSYYSTLSSVEEQLAPHGFLRIHKSFLVNMEHVRSFYNGEVILSSGTTLKVSEKKYTELKRKYLLWKGL